MLYVSIPTIERTCKCFVQSDLDATPTERPRSGGKSLLDANAEAVLVAWTCAIPPDERKHCTKQLLADKLVELGEVASISNETVRRTRKKRTPPYQVDGWCIPTVSSEFVWHMEEVLDLYQESYDSDVLSEQYLLSNGQKAEQPKRRHHLIIDGIL